MRRVFAGLGGFRPVATRRRWVDTPAVDGAASEQADSESRSAPLAPSPRREATADLHVFLIADVRGYTRYTAEHGDEAGAELARRFAEVTRSVVNAHGGRVVECRGDEALAVFNSARASVRTALALQDRFRVETTADPTRPLFVGIGIDVGEAVPIENGYRGAALNLAARLCGSAKPGEIIATQEVVHLAQAVDGARYTARGKVTVKGLADPVSTFRVARTGGDGVAVSPSGHVNHSSHLPRKMAFLLAVLLVVAGTSAAVIIAGRDRSHLVATPGDTVSQISLDRGNVLADVPVGGSPTGITASTDSIWVTNSGDGTVSRIDRKNRLVRDLITVGRSPVAAAQLGAYLWVANSGDSTVDQVSTATDQIVATVSVGNQPAAIAAGYGAVWVTSLTDATVTRIDPASDTTKTVQVGNHPDGIVAGSGAIWVANRADDTVEPIDPTSLQVGSPIAVGSGPAGLAFTPTALWVADTSDKTITEVDPRTRERVAATTVGNIPTAIAASGNSVWVSVSGDASIAELDARTARVKHVIPVGSSPQGLAVADGRLWSAQQPYAALSHRGGTLVAFEDIGIPPIADPQRGYPQDVLDLVYDGLVRMNPVSAAAGYELIPDLATTLPRPSPDGLSYTFTIRPGIKYSDGRPVLASDFRRGLTRAVLAMTDGTGVWPLAYLDAVQGAQSCTGPTHCTLGITTDDQDGIITIRLERPDPDFLAELSLPLDSPVPPGTSTKPAGSHPYPGTGPYMFSAVTSDSMLLVRNPRFRSWSVAAQPPGYPDHIQVRAWSTAAAAVKAVEEGKADLVGVTPFGHPDIDIQALRRNYPTQVIKQSQPVVHYVVLNLSRPPFNDPIARHAFELALDRTTISGILGGSPPFCGFVPPDFPGYSPVCASGLHADLPRARALLKKARPYNGKLIVNISDKPQWRPLGAYLAKVAASLGYSTDFRPLTGEAYSKALFYKSSTMNVAGDLWFPDFPAASNFYLSFSCDTLRNGPASSNYSIHCDPGLDAAAARIEQEQLIDPGIAQQQWVTFFRRLQDTLPAIPTNTDSRTVFVSARLGNYRLHPIMGDLLDQMWVR